MNKIKKFLIGGTSAALLLSNVAMPAFAALDNGSFEFGIDPGVFTTLPTDDTSITNWKVASGSVDYIGSYWQAANGSTRSVDLSGNEPGSISQEFATVNGAEYTVTFAMSGNPDGGQAEKNVDVTASGLSPMSFSFDTTGIDKTNMMWADRVYNFTATAATTTLKFESMETDAYGPAIDHIRIVEVTPTPSPTPTGPEIPEQCAQDVVYNLIEGTAGSEVLNGTSGPDLILAKGGSDVVNGKGGNDCIVGGAGSDSLHGQTGNDVILGGDGSDAIQGDEGNDWLYGQDGSDSVKGAAGNDHLFGGDNSDSLKGDGGTDTADGGNASDSCNAETETTCEA